ncbi:MAG: methyltransferase domain-containing protein [Nitrospiraceae bacterium]|nr:methyltransferase domain-containing protein [Nitrospiraceae bacterium]
MQSNIEAIDFNLLYRLQKLASTHKTKSRDAWDKIAKSMNNKIHNGSYNDTIERIVDLEGAKDILDVGCGPGTFALRLASKVEKIYALDFSKNMLDILTQNTKEQNLLNIETIHNDIEGNWKDVPVCDVVLASRCLEVDNIKAALVKLDKHAKKAVYLTFKVGKSYLDEELLRAMKRDIIPKPDYIYLVNILYQLGINPTVSFITPKKSECSRVSCVDEYVDSVRWSLDKISDEEENLIRDFYENCIKNGKNPPLRDDRWALISWIKS